MLYGKYILIKFERKSNTLKQQKILQFKSSATYTKINMRAGHFGRMEMATTLSSFLFQRI